MLNASLDALTACERFRNVNIKGPPGANIEKAVGVPHPDRFTSCQSAFIRHGTAGESGLLKQSFGLQFHIPGLDNVLGPHQSFIERNES
jgi:hypothetical protein